MVREGEASIVFNLGASWRPNMYIENDFEDKGEIVLDHATGLIWQKAGSNDWLKYDTAKDWYIHELNHVCFAGYNDWRLPTINELLSLVDAEVQSNGLYINPIFDARQILCWSADL